jgi:hypothetical protein
MQDAGCKGRRDESGVTQLKRNRIQAIRGSNCLNRSRNAEWPYCRETPRQLRKSYEVFVERFRWPKPMTPAPAYPPGASPSPESPPPFARGPSPAATAAKPKPPPADTRLPPALTEVPRRTATRRLSSPDARTRRLVRRNVGGLPANSVPFHPPPPPKPLHSAIRPPPPETFRRPFRP